MKKHTKANVSCYECKSAYLMQSAPCNPVVSECEIMHERNVASVKHNCRLYGKRIEDAVIHKMIYLK